MSKLSIAVDTLLEDARAAQTEKTASVEEAPVRLHPATEQGDGLRKLAELLRNTDANPSYSDLHSFLGDLI